MFKSSLFIAKCLLSIFLACSVEAIEFRCNFGMWGTSLGDRYTCSATVINSGSSSLERVTGNHQRGKSNEDVKFLHVIDQNLPFIPEGITDFFKNLDALRIWQSSLTTISANDLRQFTRLVYVDLYGNQLTSLDGDLFKYTPHLQIVYFDFNQIRHIGPDLVTNLNDLTELYFESNPCVSRNAETRAAVLSLAPQLSVLCPPLDVTTTTTTSTTITTPTTTLATTSATTPTEIIPAQCLCSEEIEELHELNRALGVQFGSLQVSSIEQNRKIQQLSDEIQLQNEEIEQIQQSNEQLVQKNDAFDREIKRLSAENQLQTMDIEQLNLKIKQHNGDIEKLREENQQQNIEIEKLQQQLQQSNDQQNRQIEQLEQENAVFVRRVVEVEMKLREIGSMPGSK